MRSKGSGACCSRRSKLQLLLRLGHLINNDTIIWPNFACLPGLAQIRNQGRVEIFLSFRKIFRRIKQGALHFIGVFCLSTKMPLKGKDGHSRKSDAEILQTKEVLENNMQ